jgi:hypothetical protein
MTVFETKNLHVTKARQNVANEKSMEVVVT